MLIDDAAFAIAAAIIAADTRQYRTPATLTRCRHAYYATPLYAAATDADADVIFAAADFSCCFSPLLRFIIFRCFAITLADTPLRRFSLALRRYTLISPEACHTAGCHCYEAR